MDHGSAGGAIYQASGVEITSPLGAQTGHRSSKGCVKMRPFREKLRRASERGRRGGDGKGSPVYERQTVAQITFS